MNSTLQAGDGKCRLCGQPENPGYGVFFKNATLQINVHQYCLFFASGLGQNGDDDEGFDGFLMEDILKELKRTQRLRCSSCKKLGASVGCAVAQCKINCHFHCGQKMGVLHQFFDNFLAFCPKHKPVQNMLSGFDRSQQLSCAICLESLTAKQIGEHFLRMPCCKDNYIHHSCLQQHASFSGYFFKCPMCNNKDLFIPEMKKFGVYVPDRDALWEDGVAYNDLLETYNRCDMKDCHCPEGRLFFSKSRRWKIMRCENCGQSAVHKYCARMMDLPTRTYMCDTCLIANTNARYRHMIDRDTKSCVVLVENISDGDSRAAVSKKAILSNRRRRRREKKSKKSDGVAEVFDVDNDSLKDFHKCQPWSPPVSPQKEEDSSGLLDLKCGLYRYLNSWLDSSKEFSIS